MVLFPAPVGPTKAATWPGSIFRLTSRRVGLARSYPKLTLMNSILPLKLGAHRDPGRFLTWRSVSRISLIRSNPTAAFEAVSVILDRSRIGLYILPRYNRKTTSPPVVRAPLNTRFAPYHRTRQVPAATIICTTGESIALSPR